MIKLKLMLKQLGTMIDVLVLLIIAIRLQIQLAINVRNFNKPVNIYKLFFRDKINQSIPVPPKMNDIIKVEDFDLCLYEQCFLSYHVDQPFLHSHLFS